jgi:hypothetical protein
MLSSSNVHSRVEYGEAVLTFKLKTKNNNNKKSVCVKQKCCLYSPLLDNKIINKKTNRNLILNYIEIKIGKLM